MIVGVPQETFPGERALPWFRPASRRWSRRASRSLCRPARAWRPAFPITYTSTKGPRSPPRATKSLPPTVILQVRAAGANPAEPADDLRRTGRGQDRDRHVRSAGQPKANQESPPGASRSSRLELLPRITRAQSMDVLSSQATIAGYRAVLLAADGLAQDVPHADHGRRHAQRRPRCSSSGRAWPDCRPSPPPGGWARSCRPTTFARPSRSRCRASAASSSRCRWRPQPAKAKGGYAQADGRGVLSQAARADGRRSWPRATWSSPPRPFPARSRPC